MNKPLAKALAAAFASATLLAPLAVSAQTGTSAGAAGGSMTGTTGTTPAATGAGSVSATRVERAGGALHAADRRFVEEAALSDLAEIATGKLAQQKAANDQVKQFGQHMVDDHTKTTDKLKPMAQSKGVELPSAPDRKHQRMMEKLEKESGDKFDREYMRGQVKDHEKAVRLFEREAKSGRDADLKQFASDTLPTLREHLKMAKDLQNGGKSGGYMDRNSTGTSTSMGVRGSGGASGTSAGTPAAGTGAPPATTGTPATPAPAGGTASGGASK